MSAIDEVLGVTGLIAIFACVPYVYTREAEWWKGGRPVTELTMLNIHLRTPLAFVPAICLSLAAIVASRRLAIVTGFDWLDWAAVVITLGLLVAVVVFSRPRFLLPPGYLKATAKNSNPRDSDPRS